MAIARRGGPVIIVRRGGPATLSRRGSPTIVVYRGGQTSIACRGDTYPCQHWSCGDCVARTGWRRMGKAASDEEVARRGKERGGGSREVGTGKGNGKNEEIKTYIFLFKL